MASFSLDTASFRCRKHPTQSVGGVCARCLQARLAKLAAVHDEAGRHGKNALERPTLSANTEPDEGLPKKEEIGPDHRAGTIASLIERDLEATAGNEENNATASNGQDTDTRGPAKRLSRSLSMGNASRYSRSMQHRGDGGGRSDGLLLLQQGAETVIHEELEYVEGDHGRGAARLTKSKSVGAVQHERLSGAAAPRKNWMSSPFWDRLRARGTPKPAFSYLLQYKARLFNSSTSARYKPCDSPSSSSASDINAVTPAHACASRDPYPPADHHRQPPQPDLCDHCKSHPAQHSRGLMSHYLLCCVSPAVSRLGHMPRAKLPRRFAAPNHSSSSDNLVCSAKPSPAHTLAHARATAPSADSSSAAASSAGSSCRNSSSSSNSSSYSTCNTASSEAPCAMPHAGRASLRQLLNLVSPWPAAVAGDGGHSFRRATARLSSANAPPPTIVATGNMIHVPG